MAYTTASKTAAPTPPTAAKSYTLFLQCQIPRALFRTVWILGAYDKRQVPCFLYDTLQPNCLWFTILKGNPIHPARTTVLHPKSPGVLVTEDSFLLQTRFVVSPKDTRASAHINYQVISTDC